MLHKITYLARRHDEKILALVDQAIVSGTGFAINILIARVLGLELTGVYAASWLLLLIVSSLHKAFILSPMLTLGAKTEDKTAYFNRLFAIQILFTLVTFVLLTLGLLLAKAYLQDWYIAQSEWILPGLISVFLLVDYHRRKVYILGKPKRAIILSAIAFGLQLPALFILAKLGLLKLSTAWLALLLCYATALVINYLFIDKFRLQITGIRQTLLRHWHFSKYLLGTALLQWVSGNYFLILAGVLLGPIALGVIRIVQNIMGLFNLFFAAMENVVPPKAAFLLQVGGEKHLFRYFKSIFIKAGTIMLALLAAVFFAAPWILKAVYGEKYLSYSYVLQFFTIVYIFVFIGTQLQFIIRTFERNQSILIAYVISAAASFLLAKPFISTWGLWGALWGLLAIQVISNLIYFLSIKRKILLQWKLST